MAAIARWVLGVLAGLVAMYLVVMAIEFAGHVAYPPPPGLDPTNIADLGAILGQQPLAALLFVPVAWVLGAFLGGLVAARVAARHWPRAAATVVALMVMAGVVMMIRMVPGHPQWLAVAGLLLPLPAALLGAAVARRRAPAPAR